MLRPLSSMASAAILLLGWASHAEPQRLELEVVNATTREPVASARVRITRSGATLSYLNSTGFHAGRAIYGTRYSDARGHVSLELTDGWGPIPAELQVVVDGAPGYEPYIAPLKKGEKVALKPWLPVTGRVLLPSGQPAAGARVMVWTNPLSSGTTGADGRFTLNRLADGPVVAEKDGAFGSAVGNDVELRLHQRQRENRVVDASQAPLEGVEVKLTIGSIEVRQVTGKDGKWTKPELDLPGRPVAGVALSKPGHVTRTYGTYLDDQADRMTLLTTAQNDAPRGPVQPEAFTLKVTVRDAAKKPAAGVAVSCFDGSATTGADGTATCVSRPYASSFPLRVTATTDTGSGFALAGVETKAVDIVIRPNVPLRGRIEGDFQPGSVLTVASPHEFNTFNLTGPTFDLGPRPATRTSLCVSKWKDSPPLGCALFDGSKDAVVVLGAPGKATLSVQDAKGKPVEDLVFYLNKKPLNGDVHGADATLTLPLGSHLLIINVEGSSLRAEVEVTVRSGETTALGKVTVK
jgi:hypothetical protein